MSKDWKEFKLRLPTKLAEDFYRLFPLQGERQTILRKLVQALIQESVRERDFYVSVIQQLRGDE